MPENDAAAALEARRRTGLIGTVLVGALLMSVVVVVVMIVSALVRSEDSPDGDVGGPGTAEEPFRPQFHFSPQRNWMNDPNGPILIGDRYHVFFQYNPNGDQWGDIGWGHATSADLVEWDEQPVAIPAEPPLMIFSGDVVADPDGRSAACGGEPCLVAVYTGSALATGTGRVLQDQRLAISTDEGRTWRHFDGNPVIDLGSSDFRDPNVFWHEETQRWIMVAALAVEQRVLVFGSHDLVHWDELSSFGPVGATGGVWECPVLMEVPIDGGADRRWVMKVDLNPGHPAGGSGAQYFVGDFDGTSFVADPHQPLPRWVDHGADFYCALPFGRDDGTHVEPPTWIAWMSNWRYAALVPTSPWRGALTVAREVTLVESPNGLQLRQRPMPALDDRRRDHRRHEGADVAAVADAVAAERGSVLDIELTVELASADAVALTVASGVDSGVDSEVTIRYDRPSATLSIDRTRAGVPTGEGVEPLHTAGMAVMGDPLELRVLLDRSSVEVFGADGTVVFTELHFPADGADGLRLTADGPTGPVVVDIWDLGSS